MKDTTRTISIFVSVDFIFHPPSGIFRYLNGDEILVSAIEIESLILMSLWIKSSLIQTMRYASIAGAIVLDFI